MNDATWRPALWLCARLFATPNHPPLSRSDFHQALSPYTAVSRPLRRVIALRTAALSSLMRRADACLPASGAILDAGCGHGQMARWLAREPGREVVGVDGSGPRVEVARSVKTPANLRFEHANIDDAITDSDRLWDGFTFVDLLLYLDPKAQRHVLLCARRAARPLAIMLIKDSITEPAWKRGITRAEERLKLSRGYYGGTSDGCLTYRSRDKWVALLRETGWEVVEDERTSRLLPYPGWVAVCHPV